MMLRRSALPFLGLLLVMAGSGRAERPTREQSAASRPNIVIIVADDLARSDLGYMGSEIRTPNIDALARSGMILDQFHVAPTCSPTRAMLLTGVDNHRSGLGVMGESIMPEHQGKPGHEGYLSDDVVALPERLRDAGYDTMMVGKWHLGTTKGRWPGDRGFGRSFALLEGGASHFGDGLGLSIHKLRATYVEDGARASLPTDFYSSAFYTDKLIAYVDAHEAEEKEGAGTPFFLYAAYTAPHWPLQAPSDWIDRYRGIYDDGYEALAARRLQTQQRLGLALPDATPTPLPPHVRPWNSLSAEEKKAQARMMEVYAAMVENLDFHIGRLVRHLKTIGEYEDTIFVFLADNGPEGNDVALFPRHQEFLAAQKIDDSYENIGRPGSYAFYGPGWATAAASPERLYKSFTTQGGIHAPAFVTWPGRTPAGTRSAAFLSVADVMPTMLDAAGIRLTDEHNYRGRTVVPMQGRSMLPLLEGRADRVHAADQAHGWELFNRRAIRKGDWKAIRYLPPYGPGQWQLYNLAVDPYERSDLAARCPDILADLLREWDAYVRRNGVVELDYDMDYDK